jgi:hypothetical protein
MLHSCQKDKRAKRENPQGKWCFFVFDERWAEKYLDGPFFFYQPFKWLKVAARSLVTSVPELVRVCRRTVILRA